VNGLLALLPAVPLALAVLALLRRRHALRTDHYIANAAHGSELETRPPS
jgi:hypothetical protein